MAAADTEATEQKAMEARYVFLCILRSMNKKQVKLIRTQKVACLGFDYWTRMCF